MERRFNKMPLEKGNSEKVISHNIEEMQAHGHSHEQSVAAALHTAKDDQGEYGESLKPFHRANDLRAAKDAVLNWGGGQNANTILPGGKEDTPKMPEGAGRASGVDARTVEQVQAEINKVVEAQLRNSQTRANAEKLRKLKEERDKLEDLEEIAYEDSRARNSKGYLIR
jgi:hypothetical protein